MTDLVVQDYWTKCFIILTRELLIVKMQRDKKRGAFIRRNLEATWWSIIADTGVTFNISELVEPIHW